MLRSSAVFLAAALWGAGAIAQTQTATPEATPEAAAEEPVICKVDGYDVVFVNRSEAAVEAGTRVAWSVRFARMEGVHVLAAELAPDAVHVLTGALGSSYLGTRTPCIASIADPGPEAEETAVP